MSADVSSFLSKLAIPINKPQTLDLQQKTADPGYKEKATPLSPPRGAITEISGPVSSGRTSLIHAILARATEAGECCAIVDGAGAFDPSSAMQAGVDLARLLWVRANGRLEAALKAADLILHSGGFGVIVLDLCDAPAADLNRIPLSYWYRFRGAVENTPGRFIVASHVPLAKSCARLPLVMHREGVRWTGSTPFFNGFAYAIEDRKQRVRLAG